MPFQAEKNRGTGPGSLKDPAHREMEGGVWSCCRKSISKIHSIGWAFGLVLLKQTTMVAKECSLPIMKTAVGQQRYHDSLPVALKTTVG